MEPGMDERWRRYGSAVVASMSEVLDRAHEEHRPALLETADYWLSLGIAIGLNRPDEGRRLLEIVEAEEGNRAELAADADAFLTEALQ